MNTLPMLSPLLLVAAGMALVFYGFPLIHPSGAHILLGSLIAFVIVGKAVAETVLLYRMLFDREQGYDTKERLSLRLERLFVSLGVGFCLGVVCFRLAPSASAGEIGSLTSLLEVSSIVRMEGTLEGDLRKTSSGNWMVPMRVCWVWDNRGVGSSARGTVHLLVPKDIRGYRKLCSGYSLSVEGQWNGNIPFFMVRSWNRDGSSILRKQRNAGNVHDGIVGFLMENASFFRLSLRNWITEHLTPFSWGPLALALLLGDRNELESTVSNAFREAGCAPLLALSGMHLVVFSFLFLWLGERLVGKRTALFLSTLLLWCYLYFVGASPSLLRAVLMVTLSSLCRFRGVRIKTLNILAMTFILHLVFVPRDGRNIGFMLSYLALVGLLVITPRWQYFLRPLMPQFLGEALAASLGAFFSTAPLMIAFFGVLYPVGIIVSPLVGLLVMMFMIGSLGFLFLLVCLPFFSFIIQRPLEILYTLIMEFLKIGTYVPSLSITSWKTQTVGLVFLVMLAINLLLVYGESRGTRREILGAFEHL
ncbi:MAG: ComEC/Rec2 family competence protein [Treponemataceae bacterium]|nr:ComEC/Rec2 family competence protein [Treponemataceae bacterium]